MGLYIKGIEMPTERESFNLTIKYNGTVLDTETGMQVAEVYELPPHGKCIDADALIKKLTLDEEDDNSGASLLMAIFIEVLKAAPTIIQAEEATKV